MLFHHVLGVLLPVAVWAMSNHDRHQLREEARDMFYHAYRAYMENAYPADELMPLSCAGRYRGSTPNRGDIDDSMGNFSLTLIDTLDTLVILGDLEEFDHAVRLVIRDVSFDNDVVVSVFETNIRVLGGLLSAHILAEYLQQHADVMHWYGGELLTMAKDIGYRLLPAYNTTTGIPYAKINLKYGLKTNKLEAARETCTACAGSSILEMAALSRLTGEPIFEEKAHKAMDVLWKMRHRSSDLMGTILNVHSGDWIRRDSGVGAGIDSYYEYCLKAYVLLGEEQYLNRFNRHYNAVMKYVSQGPMLLDVHMHRPHTNSRNYMDALLAFWPGLQVLKGDLKPAVETHEMLYQVMQRHKFIPEAFTTDFQVHWGNHPLRPEFLESTYFLYTATHDPYYLEVGKNVLETLQKYARVPCGYAAVNDVHTGKQEDRMDSFVLAETFKYLYLLFADPEDLLLNLDEFVFTTEGHLLPLTLGRSKRPRVEDYDDDMDDEMEFARVCPNTQQLFPETFRKPLKNMVDGVCPRRVLGKRRLTATEFSPANMNHLAIVKDMGIHIAAMSDGRVQLLHSFASAKTPADAEEGVLFMQEMVEFAKKQALNPDSVTPAIPQSVSFTTTNQHGNPRHVTLQAGPSQFGVNFSEGGKLTAQVSLVRPAKACTKFIDSLDGNIAIVERGECMFVEKARKAQAAGASGVIVIDTTPNGSGESPFLFSMSGDGTDDVNIPVVFLFNQDAFQLLVALSTNPNLEVTIGDFKSLVGEVKVSPPVPTEEDSVFQKLKVSVRQFLNKHAAGLGFVDSVTVGEFRAEIGAEKLRITGSGDPPAIFEESHPNPEWSQILRGLLKSLTSFNELFVPIRIMRIYYQTLSGDTDETGKSDSPKQAGWLLRQLAIERARKSDDNLVEVRDVSELTKDAILMQGKQHIERLSAIIKSIGALQKQVSDEIQSSEISRGIGNLEGEGHSDDLVIGSEVIVDAEQTEDSDKKQHTDEL